MAKVLDIELWKNLPQRSPGAPTRLGELELRFRLSNDMRERASIADVLVPNYISGGDRESAARTLSGVVGDVGLELEARLAVLRVVVRAMEGAPVLDDLAPVIRMIPSLSEASAVLVWLRAAIACFFAHHTLAAEEYALQALWQADVAGLRRLGAGAAGILYNLHYHLTGDLHTARYYAEVATIEASAAGDLSSKRRFLIAQYDLAAVFAEWDTASALRELLRRERGAESPGAGTVVRIADVLLHGQRGDFVAMCGTLDSMMDGLAETADHALVRALRALALAGSGNDADARGEARRALGLSRASESASELAHLVIRRRIAAILAAYVSIIVGDTYHGTRALRVRSKWPGSIGWLSQAFEGQLRGSQVDLGDPNLRAIKGYAVVAAAAEASRSRRLNSIPPELRALTQTEVVLLREAATGKTNGEIARERGVTRNAVERRLMSAYEKLGARSRAEAVAKFMDGGSTRLRGA